MEEVPNTLDYLSDLTSFALAEYYCQLCTHLTALPSTSQESFDNRLILDVGGDIGIHAHLLSKLIQSKTVVLDIRKRIDALNPLLLKNQFHSIIKDGVGTYKESWLPNIKEEDFKKTVQDLYSSLYLHNVQMESSSNSDVEYFGDNFYSYEKKAVLITSFSSLDYFSAPEFFAKCSSIQNPGGLVYAWIPSFVFHFNPINLIFNDTLSAPATLSISEIIFKSLIRFGNINDVISKLFWYQNGDGPMVLENYCDILKNNGYSILSQHRPSISSFDSKSGTYSLNWYGRNASFSEKQVHSSIEKAKEKSPKLAKYVVAEDFFAPYYYILAKKTNPPG